MAATPVSDIEPGDMIRTPEGRVAKVVEVRPLGYGLSDVYCSDHGDNLILTTDVIHLVSKHLIETGRP